MLRFTSFACAVLLPLAVSGCPSTSCEAGTVLSGGACVPADGGSDTCARSYYADDDMDGHGDPDGSVTACAPPTGYVASSDDCDDTTAMRAPGRTETCDGLDNDCDDAVDQTFACAQGATVTCTTTCGSTGTATCASDCSVPTSCTPPAETCSGVDDDCDGRVDEGVLTVGPRQDLGTTSVTAPGVVVVPTRAGFAVFRENDSGSLVARQLDASGGPTGSLVTVSSTWIDGFDAYWTGTQILVSALSQGTGVISFVRYEDDLTMAFAQTVRSIGARAPLEVVAADGAAIVAFDTSSGLGALRLSYPDLSGTPATMDMSSLFTRDLVLDDARSEAYLLFGDLPAPIGARRLAASGTFDGTNLFYDLPTIDVTGPAAADLFRGASANRLLMVQAGRNVGGMGGLEALSGEIASDASFDELVRGPILTGLATAEEPVLDLAIAHALGRFFVAAIVTDAAGATSWVVLEVAESSDGTTLEVTSHTIEATTDAAHVSIAARPDGAMVTVGATNGGAVRGYLLGCP